MWFNKGLAVLPNVKLITNIGFYDARSGITKQDINMNKERYEINLKELIPPKTMERNIEADEYTMEKAFALSLSKLFTYIIRKLRLVYEKTYKK
jgi:hypothetical protein